jgi:hypothetical protein
VLVRLEGQVHGLPDVAGLLVQNDGLQSIP